MVKSDFPWTMAVHGKWLLDQADGQRFSGSQSIPAMSLPGRVLSKWPESAVVPDPFFEFRIDGGEEFEVLLFPIGKPLV